MKTHIKSKKAQMSDAAEPMIRIILIIAAIIVLFFIIKMISSRVLQ